jgi:hypothetical protein
MHRRLSFCLLLILAGLLCTPAAQTVASSGDQRSSVAWETTVVLQQGRDSYTGCRDSYIYQFDPDNTVNYRWQAQLKVGYRQYNAALLHFDLSSIPASASITHATLQLYAEGWSGADATIGAYAILRDTNVHHATWNQAAPGNPWAVPGCNSPSSDRFPIAESSITTNSIRKWYTFDLSHIVQQWLNHNLSNNGVLLRATYGPSSIYFSSAQSGAQDLRPKLSITYRTADAPTPAPTSTGTPGTEPTPSSTLTATSTRPHAPTPSPSPSSAGSATTIALQQGRDGYTGCRDSYIYQFEPDNSSDYRWQGQLKVGHRQYNAALLRFDLTSIPANASVTQATLQLYAEGWSGSDATIGAYTILRDTDIDHATWNQAAPANPWAVPGCNSPLSDRYPLAESSITTSGVRKWYTFDLHDIVQQWLVHDLTNNGVLLRAEYGTSSIYFSSSQSGVESFRPKLIIAYRTSDAPTPAPTWTRTPRPTAGATPTATLDGTRLTIAHITDAHVGGSWVYSQRLPYVVRTLSQRADVMVDTGDCTEHGNAEESADYRSLVDREAGIPWRAAPGNHDTPAIFERYIGPLDWSLDVGAYRLIGINTENIDYSVLDAALTHDRTCIIFGHFPLSWCDPADQSKLRQRFRTYSVPIYVAGHSHLDSTEVDAVSGTVLLTGQRAGLGHYRLITLQGSEILDITFENAWG